jgi:uncharacterized protein involved in exopolysaccharide biosynthesis
MEQEYLTNTLRDFLTVIFKHKLKILTVFPAVVIIVTAGSFSQIPVYEAESSLMVQIGREYIFRPEVGETKPTIQFNRNDVINADIQILASADLIEKVIINLGVENIYPGLVKQPPDQVNQPPERITPLQKAIRRFKSQLSVEAVKNSNVINLSFKHTDQQVPARAVNQLVESFKERHLQLYSNSQSVFLEGQLTVHRQRLQESENKLAAFKQKNRVFSHGEQRSNLLDQHLKLDTSLKTAQSDILELRQYISSLTTQKQKASEDIRVAESTSQSTNIEIAQAGLLKLQLEEEELRTKYDERDPMLVMVREKIALTEDFLEEMRIDTSRSVTVGKNTIYQGMEKDLFRARAELSSLDAKGAALKQQLNQLDGEIQDLDAKESALRSLQRELDNNERNYEIYLTKLEEARITDQMDRSNMANIKVIQKATVPLGPVRSRKTLRIVAGIILGAASGLALAFFSEYIIEQGISSPEGVKKRLGLPVLATVPYKEQKKAPA